MPVLIDKDIMKDLFNSNEFKGWLLSRRWFGDKSELSNLQFKITFDYFQLLAERLLLTVIRIKTDNYTKAYFLPMIFYKKIIDLLEPNERNTENVVKITDNTFSKKLALTIQGKDKILDVNLVEAEYCLLFWRKVLFDKEISEVFPSLELNLTLYTEQFEDEINMNKVQQLIEASLYPDKFEIQLEQLGKGNTTNMLFLLSLNKVNSPEQKTTYVLKSYKEFQESIEPKKLLILVRNNFPHSPKIYGTIKIKGMESIGIMENVPNDGNIGDIFWNELNDMVKVTFKSINQEYSHLKEKPAINKLIEENCEESLKLSKQIGTYIEELHGALVYPGEMHFSRQNIQKDAFLEPYTKKLEVLIEDIQNMMQGSSRNTFFNLPKISAILIDIKDIIEKFKREFQIDQITIQPVHQDLHMEQILYQKSNGDYDFKFLDFEGDPQLSIEEKRNKFPMEKDLASFLRSLSYIKFNTFLQYIQTTIPDDSYEVPEEILYSIFFKKAAKTRKRNKVLQILFNLLNTWEKKIIGLFLGTLDDTKVYIPIINYFTIERVLREISYEVLFRPNKIIVPVLGLKELIDQY